MSRYESNSEALAAEYAAELEAARLTWDAWVFEPDESHDPPVSCTALAVLRDGEDRDVGYVLAWRENGALRVETSNPHSVYEENLYVAVQGKVREAETLNLDCEWEVSA